MGAWPHPVSGSPNLLHPPFAIHIGCPALKPDLPAKCLCNVSPILHDQVDCRRAAAGKPEACLFHHLPAMPPQPMRRVDRKIPDPAMIPIEPGHDTCNQKGPDMANQQRAMPIIQGQFNILLRAGSSQIRRAGLPEPGQPGPV